MTVCVHLCRGNFRSSWAAEGGYEPVAEVLFNQPEIDGYFLEYDSDRAGGFDPVGRDHIIEVSGAAASVAASERHRRDHL